MNKCDFIVRSKNVFTAKPPLDVRELAFSIKDGKIEKIGEPSSIINAYPTNTELIDFKDKLICPGFHDSHLHFFHTSLTNSPHMLMCMGKSEADLVEKTKKFAKTLDDSSWIVTQGWRYYRWNPKKYPSKHSLDEAFPTRPCVMYSGDGHTLWLNTCAMEKLKLTRDENIKNDPGCDLEDDGDLSGIFHESLAMRLLPKCLEWLSDKQITSAYEDQMKRMRKLGLTSFCDMSLMPLEGCDFIRDDVYDILSYHDNMLLRAHLFPTLLEDTSRLTSLEKKYEDNDFVFTSGFKQFFDGVSSEHTAYLTEPYTNARFEGDRGRVTIEKEEMRKLVLKAASMRKPIRIHTIGDAAIHEELQIYLEAINEFGQPKVTYKGREFDAHNTLEHLENLLNEDIDLLRQTKTIASSQPCHITLDPGGPERDLGDERCKLMWPFKTYEENKILQSFGTDSPITQVDPMNVLYTAITRKDPFTHEPRDGWHPEQKITPALALFNYTYGSACAASNEHNLGSLEENKFADFTILDQNILECDPEKIQDTKVIDSYVAGKSFYD